MFTQKLQSYCEHRASGVPQRDAAIHAGYSLTAASVTASRNESRQDVQKEIARIKKLIKAGKGPTPTVRIDNGPPTDRQPATDQSSPLAPWGLKDKYASPLDLMIDVMNNPKAPIGMRVQAAKDAMPYVNARKAESGKKEKAQEDAEKAAGSRKSRFATQATPMRRVK